MKKSVYSVVLGLATLLALSACVETTAADAPGGLYRKQVLWLRGDGYAVQRFEACPQGTEGERPMWHHRHHRRHKVDAVKTETKKETVKKDEKKSDKKDSKKDAK